MLDKAPLTVVIEEMIDSSVVEDARDALSIYADDAHVEVVPGSGLQASILLLSITSVIVFSISAFFGKLGQRPAEDTYPRIKNALPMLYSKYFGKISQREITVLTAVKSEAKKAETKNLSYCRCIVSAQITSG